MISAAGLSRSFNGHPAVEDVSFDLPPGSLLALLGPNGAGKTTTIRLLLGLIRPTAGTAVVAGIPLSGDDQARRNLRGSCGFLTEARFPGVAISHAWPDEALDSFGLDARSAVVTLSHDPKLDDPALHSALRSNCYYIGALGSRRTQAKRRARLAEAGFDEARIARIHGPVGLDIGAGSPAEIALSIAAELTACLRKRP